MVNNRRRSNRPNAKRSSAKRRGRIGPVVRNATRSGVTLGVVRDFICFAKQITSDDKPTSTWLDHLRFFGAIAMKLFLHAVTSGIGDPTKSFVPVGAVQSILIGADDLIAKHAITETEALTTADHITYLLPCVDYRQCLVHSITVSISSGSPLAKRAGRLVAVLLELTEEEIQRYSPTSSGKWNEPDTWSFTDVCQMPGSLTAPFGTPLTLSWRPSANTFARRALRIGQPSYPYADPTKDPVAGGKPVCRLIIGYQDFASGSGSFDGTYDPADTLINVTVRGRMTLSEQGRSYLRPFIPVTQNTETAGVSTEASCGKPIHEVRTENLRLTRDGIVCVDREMRSPNL